MTGAVTRSARLQVPTSVTELGVWEWTLDDDRLVWDATMHRLYDTSPDEFVGAYGAWRSRVHPDDLAATEAELRDALAGTRAFQTPFRVVWKNGSVRHLRPAAAVQRDPATGQPIRVVGVSWDITEQRVAERALRSAEALRRGILAHAGSSIIATDCDGTITLFNPAAEELLGYAAAELVGRASSAVLHDPEEVRARRWALEHELGFPVESPFDVVVFHARPGKPEVREWSYVRKDGSRVPVLLTVSVLRDDDGETLGYLAVAVDLMLRKEHERSLMRVNSLLEERSAQAESATHAKRMFLANMSHEIRTPMNAITGVTYLLNQTPLLQGQADLVETLRSATEILLGMINNVFDLSNIEAQQLTLDEGPLQLSQVPVDEVAGGQRLSGTRLLVVDDSKLNQLVATRIMEHEGARVETADHGLAAVSCVQAAPDAFDAVLMDVQMPELDGIEATRRIRAIAGCAGLPIIAVTAGALAGERQRALAAGVDVVISKPFDPEVVIASVRKHVQRVARRRMQVPRRTAAPPDWPLIDGIDARDVQRRLGGDAQLFRSLLRLFVAEPDVLDDLSRILAVTPSGAGVMQAVQCMHKLRGTAGTLGAHDLQVAASETEQALRAAQLPAARDGLRRVADELARVRRSAAAVLEASRPRAPIAAGSRTIDPAALATLVRYLRDHDMEASTAFAALSQALAQVLGGAEHARMSGLLDRLEFDAALEIVRTLEPHEPGATRSAPSYPAGAVGAR